MAHSKSALKRWRQNERHRERNKGVRTAARSAVKKAHAVIEGGSDAQAAIREAASILDRASKGNVVHKNAVARHKSRMARHASKLATAAAVVAEAPKKARRAPAKKAEPAPKAEKPKAEKAAKEKAPAKPRAKKTAEKK